jgi:hypothetical protein
MCSAGAMTELIFYAEQITVSVSEVSIRGGTGNRFIGMWVSQFDFQAWPCDLSRGKRLKGSL